MYLIIEEYQYTAEKVEKILDGISTLRGTTGKISVNYVGYYYNPTLKDCVFILPKVLLEVKDKAELVFGKYKPEDILHLEKANLEKEELNFIYELAVWVYRAIVVFNDTHKDNEIVNQQFVAQMSKGRIRQCNTFLDILLAIQKFNKENQNFFFFVMKNLHSGFNKINWTKTISRSQAIVQDGTPIYIDVVNKKKQINFDEELLVIFFSILNYMHEKFGFPVNIAMGFDLIKGNKFKQYMEGMGCVRLHQIKYKYFSDIALYLWELCYAFFDKSKKINVCVNEQEYLLVSNFNIVFEEIIDVLIGDDAKTLGRMNELKEQKDGKRADHIYTYQDLTENKDHKPIYYIGDSKYYKRNNNLGTESVYKQFTYAKNVIQWNLDLFNSDKPEDIKEQEKHLPLRDEWTEGYNIIPNFFISAHQNTLTSEDDIEQHASKTEIQRHVKNRLYDRDTLILSHYDVNFLFVVSLYGRNNKSQKEAWKQKVRKIFRKKIREVVQEQFQFYVVEPMLNVDARSYINEHFKDLIGKIYTPYESISSHEYYSLALSKDESFDADNKTLLDELSKAFYIAKIDSIETEPGQAMAAEKAAPSFKYDNKNWDGKYAIVIDDRAGDEYNRISANGCFVRPIDLSKDISLLNDIIKAKYAIIIDSIGAVTVYDMPFAAEMSSDPMKIAYCYPVSEDLFSQRDNVSAVIEYKISLSDRLALPIINKDKLINILNNYHADSKLPPCVDFKDVVEK